MTYEVTYFRVSSLAIPWPWPLSWLRNVNEKTRPIFVEEYFDTYIRYGLNTELGFYKT